MVGKRRRGGLGADYFAEVAEERRQAVEEPCAPKAKPSAPAGPVRTKATFYLRRDLLDELRAASLDLPPRVLGGSLSELVERALEVRLEELRRKHHDGQPFEASGGRVRRGRPPKR